MSHWLERLWSVSTANTNNLIELADLLGVDAKTFYVGQDLSACDLRGQDLRGIDLTGTNLEKAIIDEATKISPVFDPRVPRLSDYVDIDITQSLNHLILAFSEEANYRYPAWAYKALIERGINAFRWNQWQYYTSLIADNSYLRETIDHTSKSSLLTKKMQVYDWQQRFITVSMGQGISGTRFALTMLVGFLSTKIPFGDNKDYSQLKATALIKRKTLFDGSELDNM